MHTLMSEYVTQVRHKLKSLKDISLYIDNNFTQFQEELKSRRLSEVRAYETATVELREASAQGDRSENAEFTAALEKLQQLQLDIVNIDEQLRSMNFELDIRDYVPIGMVVMYATVFLRDNKGEMFIFKIYPDNISDIDKCILAKNSRLGMSLWLKSVGDVVEVEEMISGEKFTYEILEIY